MATKGKGKTEKSQAQKEADFRKLAEKHANTAVAAIGRLSKLANARKYAWTPAQLKLISDGINGAMSACAAAFEGKATANVIKL